MDQTGIYNAALGRVGHGDAVAAPTDHSVAAQTCNRFYDSCRREVLRAFAWPFAMRSVALARVADDSFPGWAYVYQYPDRCARVLVITDDGGLRWTRSWYALGGARTDSFPGLRTPWQIALRGDGARQVILSDVESAHALFTYDVDNTGAFPADFASVLAWRLAIEIGGPLQAKRDLIADAENRYLMWYSRAAATSMNEGRDDAQAESASITARY